MLYEDVVFMQSSEDTDEVFEILDEKGEDEAIEFLKQWHYPGEHQIDTKPPWGSSDTVYEDDDGYLLIYNERLGYIGLTYQQHPQYRVDTWFERDRANVTLYEDITGKEIVSWWDDDVHELVEDGFLDPKDWKGSAIEYAQHLGMITED